MMLTYQGKTGVRSSDFKVGMLFKADDGTDVAVILSTELLEDIFGAQGNYKDVAEDNSHQIGLVASNKYKKNETKVILTTADFN